MSLTACSPIHLQRCTCTARGMFVSATPTGVFTLLPDRASMRSALEPDKGGAFQSLLPNRL